MIKINKNDNILVRIGGGYMGIEEFIDIYSKDELEKLQQRKKVLSKF